MMLSIVYIQHTHIHTHSMEKCTNNSSFTKQHTHDEGRKGRKSVDKIKRPFNSSIPYICTWRSIWNVYEKTGWKTAHVTRAIPIWIDSMRKKKESFENHSQICAWFWQQHPYTYRNAHTLGKHWWRRLNNKRKMRKYKLNFCRLFLWRGRKMKKNKATFGPSTGW